VTLSSYKEETENHRRELREFTRKFISFVNGAKAPRGKQRKARLI
jgi:hypothetical protein